MSLHVSNLCKIYGNKTVVDNVSFDVDAGKVYGILGRNGAGKTTTIRMILNIITKDKGEVLFNGKKLDVIKSRVSYLPEEKTFYYKNKVKDQLIYFAMLSGLKYGDAKKEIKYWLDRFDIGDSYNKVVDTLSKGNQQKIQIISSIVNDPEIIIFDEPFSGLDPINSQILKDIIREFIKKGKYILLSTHQMFYVEEFCDGISIFKSGKQRLKGNILEIKKSYGRNKLLLEIEGNLPDLKIYGVNKISKVDGLYEIEVSNENISNDILSILFQNKVKILNFSLKYKSLHEIFLDVAGD